MRNEIFQTIYIAPHSLIVLLSIHPLIFRIDAEPLQRQNLMSLRCQITSRDVFRCQIMTSRDGPRTKRVKPILL